MAALYCILRLFSLNKARVSWTSESPDETQSAENHAEGAIPIDDLHEEMIHRLNLARGDRFHWNREGSQILARAVVKSILPFLQNMPSSVRKEVQRR